jgi:multidrug efflux pump
VGGISIGTFFTLIVLPPVYILIAKDHSKDRAREAGTEAVVAESATSHA